MDALRTFRTHGLEVLDADLFVAPGRVEADVRESIKYHVGLDVTTDDADDLEIADLVSTLRLNRTRTPRAYWKRYCEHEEGGCVRPSFWVAFSWSRCWRLIEQREERRGARSTGRYS